MHRALHFPDIQRGMEEIGLVYHSSRLLAEGLGMREVELEDEYRFGGNKLSPRIVVSGKGRIIPGDEKGKFSVQVTSCDAVTAYDGSYRPCERGSLYGTLTAHAGKIPELARILLGSTKSRRATSP